MTKNRYIVHFIKPSIVYEVPLYLNMEVTGIDVYEAIKKIKAKFNDFAGKITILRIIDNNILHNKLKESKWLNMQPTLPPLW